MSLFFSSPILTALFRGAVLQVPLRVPVRSPLGLCAGLGFSVLGSLGFLSSTALAQNTTQLASALDVPLRSNSTAELNARGLVRSAGRVEFRTDLVASVLHAPFLEGMAFKKGDILIDFDCKRHRAELKVAQAQANTAWIDHKSKKRLLAHKAIGRDEVAMAAAAAAEATAEVNVHKIKGESCQFKAPFTGRMVELNAHPNELPGKEKPLLVIIKDSVLELEMVVPSFWLTWMEKGQSFKFKIDETGETLDARIERIGAEVDPVSQTVKIVGLLNTKGTRTLSGMSGNAWFGSKEVGADKAMGGTISQ